MDFLTPIFDVLTKLVTAFLSIGKSSSPDDKPSDLVAKIQELTVSFCGFLPMAESVISLLSATYPGIAAPLAAADQVARSICQAASAAKPQAFVEAGMVGTTQQSATVTVNGVAVSGVWVKR